VEDDEIALRMDAGRKADATRRQRVQPYNYMETAPGSTEVVPP
jgi:hypothetical protein